MQYKIPLTVTIEAPSFEAAVSLAESLAASISIGSPKPFKPKSGDRVRLHYTAGPHNCPGIEYSDPFIWTSSAEENIAEMRLKGWAFTIEAAQ